MIRLAQPSFDEKDFAAIRAVLQSGQLVQGARVAAFEEALAAKTGTRYAVAVSSGTAALHLALLAIGVRPNDLVIVPAYSFVATANVVELCGARPVFVDIDARTFNIDPQRLEGTLTELRRSTDSSSRIKAIMPVHTFGQMADMTAIREISDRYEVPILEDAACALGAMWRRRQAGTWGAAGCLSFHPRKIITTGEGGAIVTDDEAVARQTRALRNHGQDPDSDAPRFSSAGYNYRMTELQAALGSTQLRRADDLVQCRRRLARRYDRFLQDAGVQIPFVAEEADSTYQSYVVMLPDRLAALRPQLIRRLKANGVETGIGTWHLPATEYFRARYGHADGDFPRTDHVFPRTLSLPLYEGLSARDQDSVVHELTEACKGSPFGKPLPLRPAASALPRRPR